MAVVKKYEGNLVVTGAAEYERGRGNSEPATMYDYWRIESHGENIFLQRVVVPALIDSVIKTGANATFYFVELSLPTFFFASKPMYLVYGVKTNEQLYEAIGQVRILVRAIKFGAAKLFFAGVPAMFLWGVGLLLWIMAARIVMISLNTQAMQRQLV